MKNFCSIALFSFACIASGSLTANAATPATPANNSTAPATASTASTAPLSLLKQIDTGFEQIFEKVSPTVVVIDATDPATPSSGSLGGSTPNFFFRNAPSGFGSPRPQKSEGSGIIVRSNGIIFTNNHVIAGSDKIEVRLKDGRRFSAKVLGTDDKTDIAVLKIDAKNLPVATFANSDAVKVGQMVCAIGTPYDLDYTFTCGWVSAKDRSNLNPASANPPTIYQDYIQTDAAIHPGDSGGPLVDTSGRVVGMNTLIDGVGRGLAFAIPSNMVQSIGDQIIAHGKAIHPWLGVQIQTLSTNAALRSAIKSVNDGVVVMAIEGDSPAAKSDLRPADVIAAVNQTKVKTALQLQKAILEKKVGDKVSLSVWRRDKSLQISVTLGALPDDLSRLASRSGQPSIAAPKPSQPKAGDWKEDGSYGLHMENIPTAVAKKQHLKTDSGVFVNKVDPNSPAAIAGLQPNDIVTEIDSMPVKNAADAKAAIKNHHSQKGVLLFVDRDGQKTYAVLKK